jgi:hypothetical protein
MRLIINANTTLLQNKLQDVINVLEIDLVNKYIGVDNYLNQVKTNDLVLGHGISFMNSSSIIGSLSQSAGKSILSIDKLVIQAGGSIDMTGAGNTMAIKRLGVGIAITDLASDGLFIGKDGVLVPSTFYGPVSFASQSITQSSEVITPVQTYYDATSGHYYGEIKVTSTSKQFIYVTILAPSGQTPSSSNGVYLSLYEDSTARPNVGQSFTIIVKDYQNSAGTSVATSAWGNIVIMPGFDSTTLVVKTPIVINNSQLTSGVATFNAAYGDFATHHINKVTFFNSNVNTNSSSTSYSRNYGGSVTLTKFENGPANAYTRFVITGSHNIVVN